MVLKQILTSTVRSFVPPSIYNILTNIHDVWEECTVPKENKAFVLGISYFFTVSKWWLFINKW